MRPEERALLFIGPVVEETGRISGSGCEEHGWHQ
jgi:hypothetical protein